jgi:hypothetical protein
MVQIICREWSILAENIVENCTLDIGGMFRTAKGLTDYG